MRTAKTLIRLGGRPGWSESLLGAHAILLVLSWGSSYYLLDGEHQNLSRVWSVDKKNLYLTHICLVELSILINWTSPFPILGRLVHPYQLDEPISNFRVSGVLFFILFWIDIPVSKQWRLWSDAAFCGVWSGSALCAYFQKWDARLMCVKIIVLLSWFLDN